jgi:putative transposase
MRGAEAPAEGEADRLESVASPFPTIRRHTLEDVTAILRQAEQMSRDGAPQKMICRKFGISVMTYHRWRKRERDNRPSVAQLPPTRLQELRLENDRLRRIASDLLMEKARMQDALQNALDAYGAIADADRMKRSGGRGHENPPGYGR